MRRTSLLVAVLAAGLSAVPVQAQTRPQPRPPRPFVERGYVVIGAGVQTAGSGLNDRVEFDANAETGTIDADYPSKAAFLFEAGAGMRIRGRLGVGAAFSRSTASGDAAIAAQIPHPFFDNRHRAVAGETGDIRRTETAVHGQLYYDLQPRGRWRVRLFAGPSYVNIEQDLVASVQAIETFPYDTAEFRSATTDRAKGSGIGVNAGADISRMLSRRIGANLLVRYTRATIDLNASGARDVSTTSGGLQAGAGLRLLF